MAFPTIPTVAAGRVLVANQADTSATRTFPNLSSLTKNAGDRLVAIIVGYQTSTGTNAAFSSWGAGFSEIHDSATSTTLAIGIAEKISDGTETGTFTVTQAGTITGHASMILLSIPGAHASTPSEAGSRVSGTGTIADPGSFNPTGWDAEDTLWVAINANGMTNASGAWAATGNTPPTNYTDRVNTNTPDSSVVGQTELAVSFRQLNAAAEDVGTGGGDTSNARNASVVLAIRPAASVLHEASPSDGLGLTDTAAAVQAADRSTSDPLGLTDTAAAVQAATRDQADALGLTDELDAVLSRAVELADALGLTDTAAAVQAHGRPAEDPLGLTDELTAAQAAAREPSDALGLTDTLELTVARLVELVDTLGLSDTAAAVQAAARALSDALGLTDTATAAQAAARTSEDALGLTDQLAAVLQRAVELVDGLGLTDQLSAAQAATRGPSDVFGLTDNLTVELTASRELVDVVGYTDTLTAGDGEPQPWWEPDPVPSSPAGVAFTRDPVPSSPAAIAATEDPIPYTPRRQQDP